jgi:hypothetical protein
MGRRENEHDRLRRLRDQQLRSRDPSKKDRRLQHNISKRYRSTREPLSFGKMMSEVPRKWTGLIIGLFLGFIIFILLPYFVTFSWVDAIGIAAILFLALLGFAIGQAADAKAELEDLIKKR